MDYQEFINLFVAFLVMIMIVITVIQSTDIWGNTQKIDILRTEVEGIKNELVCESQENCTTKTHIQISTLEATDKCINTTR